MEKPRYNVHFIGFTIALFVLFSIKENWKSSNCSSDLILNRRDSEFIPRNGTSDSLLPDLISEDEMELYVPMEISWQSVLQYMSDNVEEPIVPRKDDILMQGDSLSSFNVIASFPEREMLFLFQSGLNYLIEDSLTLIVEAGSIIKYNGISIKLPGKIVSKSEQVRENPLGVANKELSFTIEILENKSLMLDSVVYVRVDNVRFDNQRRVFNLIRSFL